MKTLTGRTWGLSYLKHFCEITEHEGQWTWSVSHPLGCVPPGQPLLGAAADRSTAEADVLFAVERLRCTP